MADNSKTYVHWAKWADQQEQEWIEIGRTVFDANGRGETKFKCTPTSAWGWRCVTLPQGERPPELAPLPLRPRQAPQQPAADPGDDADEGDDGEEILPGARAR